MAKLRSFTKKQLASIRNKVEHMVNDLPPDVIDRCHEKNIKEVHNILDECLNERIELKKVGDEAVKALKEAEEFDSIELTEGLFVGETKEVKEAKETKEVEEVKEKTKVASPKAKKASSKKSTGIKKEKEIVEETSKEKAKKVIDRDVTSDKEKEPVTSIKEEVKSVHVAKVLSDSLDIAISFDTTGSMYSVLATVRREVQNTVKQLFSTFGKNKLRISIIAHGDYCDKDHPYTIKVLDFTDDIDKICSFVKNVESTFGGDTDECYELVLNTARTVLNWRGGSEKILMMIGDCSPHPVGYKCYEMSKPNEIDWENEAKLLNDMNVRIYGVHALHYYRGSSTRFYKKISNVTGGVYLTLDNFGDVLQLVSATCYKNHSEESYNEFINVIKDNKIGGRTLWDNIRRLNGEFVEDDSDSSYKDSSRKSKGKSSGLTFKTIPGLNPVPAGRFQVIGVESACSIKGFVESNGIKYKVGRAFYELTKTEDVQQYKEIILQDKESGDMYYGDEARKHLKLLPQCTRSGSYGHEKIKPDKNDTYRVFVQSTSVNRKLVANTKLLYEISEI